MLIFFILIADSGVTGVVLLAGGVKDAKPYFTDRNSLTTFAKIFCYRCNSTDEFSESLGDVTPPHRLPYAKPLITGNF